MLNIDSYYEILDLMEESIEHENDSVSYVSNSDGIMEIIKLTYTDYFMPPEYINFNVESDSYYKFTLFNDGYWVEPLLDENGNSSISKNEFVFIDELVPEKYRSGDFVVISWGEYPECENCTYNCNESCCKKDNNKSELTRIDTNDDGKVSGFYKSWTDGNSSYSYSYHSSNEDNVIRTMKEFGIKS